MARRKLFKFKLTKKQKRGIIVSIAMALCAFGIFWFFARPVTIKKTASYRAPIIPAAAAPTPIPKRPAKTFLQRFTSHPKVAFVIDDIGYHLRDRDRLAALSNNVTYAILPLLPYSRYFGNLSRTTGAEVILHLPLDTTQNKIPGRGLIVDTMSEEDILSVLAHDLDSVPNHVGVNNHMGSRGTTCPEMMTVILKDLKRRGLFFLDSYTSMESVVPSVARKIDLPILTRGVFLDNEDSKPAILSQLKQLRQVAREKGNAIAIGHYRTKTLEVLATEIPAMEDEGFEVITLEDMLHVQRD
ncbi:MAG: divergent polysaccharide deacetylase family protein [Candidatus Omnitrophica bacterium]|nr:divergent polysaccharide deacetylase family protein [Candidatus Omnitrophota bacterium]